MDNIFLEKVYKDFSNLNDDELREVVIRNKSVNHIELMFMVGKNKYGLYVQREISIKTQLPIYTLKAISVKKKQSCVNQDGDYSSGYETDTNTTVYIKRPAHDTGILNKETFKAIQIRIEKVLCNYYPTSASFKRFMRFFKVDLREIS